MSRVAPPDRPAARARPLKAAASAFVAAAWGGAAAFVWVVVACELLTLLAWLISGAGGLEVWARGGLALAVLSLRAEVSAVIPALSGLTGLTRPIDVSLVFVPMLVTLAFVWLAGRAGRRAADRRPRPAGWVTVALAAAGAAAPVAALSALSASAARLTVPTLSVELAGDPKSAALWGAGVAAVAAGLGAALRPSGGSTIGRLVRGGLIGYGWALALLTIGVLAIAALEPRATRAYLSGVEGLGPIGPATVGVHVLSLPAQSALLVVPASGTCLEVVVGTPALTLCPWRVESDALGSALIPAGIRLSPWSWALSAVPAVAAFLGGRRSALAVAGRRAIALGGASALAFGALSVVGAWFATPNADGASRDVFFLPVTVRFDPVRLSLMATAWTVLGGSVGGWLEGRNAEGRL